MTVGAWGAWGGIRRDRETTLEAETLAVGKVTLRIELHCLFAEAVMAQHNAISIRRRPHYSKDSQLRQRNVPDIEHRQCLPARSA